MGFAPKPWGSTPSDKPAKPVVPQHVKDSHVTVPKDRLRRIGLVVGAIALALVMLAGGYELGQHHGPAPTPAPRPAPVDGKLWVVLVKDANAPGQDFAQLEADPSLGEGINALGGHLLIWGSDSPLLEERGLKGHFDKVGAPALLIEAEGHKTVAAEKCPMKAAEVVARVKAFKEHGR